MKSNNPYSRSGFSLFEMVVVIIIIGILLSVGVPTFHDYQVQKQLEESRDILESNIQKQFSHTRSQSKVFGIMGTKNNSSITLFSCKYKTNSGTPIKCCQTETPCEEDLRLFNNSIKNIDDFWIQFTPPHGDFDINNTILPSHNIIGITNQNFEKLIKIHKQSGLIEPLYKK